MAEDIYPLGLGGGLLTDAVNFALNNIYQYGQRTKESNQRMGAAMTDVAAGKSADLGPLISDIVSASPLYTGLINWTGMTDPAKAMLQRFGRAYPNMLSAMEKAPQIMEASISKTLPSDVAGSLSKPVPSAHFMEIRPDYAANLPTIGHEMQHSLNAPRVAATNPLDALTIGTLLHDVLPAGNRQSLNTVLHKQLAPPTFLQRMGLVKPPQNLQVANPDRQLMRNAMDEGLAYLGQNAAEGKGGDIVKLLADRLGVNWERPGVKAGLGDAASTPLYSAKEGNDLLNKIFETYKSKAETTFPDAGSYPKEHFIKGILDSLHGMTPVSSMRRTLKMPENLGANSRTPLPPGNTLDILEALDRSGALSTMDKFQIGDQAIHDTTLTDRIRRLLARTGRF